VHFKHTDHWVYMFLFCHHYIRGEKTETVIKFKQLGTTEACHNCIHKEFNSILNSENLCYHSFQNLLPSCQLPKDVQIIMYTAVTLPVIMQWYESLSP
jgi:hypothetical protein